ncbi:ATP-dependent DNA helicase RecG [Candidatus Saccharibacteria bacterium]|nr:ATP-dependent DNA helicase RecG [Candidatus Saccharibacteria bacterium]
MKYDISLSEVKGVGSGVLEKLARLGIHSVSDLLEYFPRRYEDYSQIVAIDDIKPGMVTIQAKIMQVKGRYVRRGMHITEAVASDDTGSVRLIWFNQPYRANALKNDVEYYISGDFGLRRQYLTIQNPSTELVSEFPLSTARIVPIYRETKGLKSQQLRKILRSCITEVRVLAETLPDWLVTEQHLMSRANAVETIHFPHSSEKLEKAKERLGFEEVFQLTLAALLNKYELLQEVSVEVAFDEKLAKDFVKHLPFTLTDAQKRAIWQIYLDMQKSQPMNRLLEGDVGSGKTVVAAMAAVMAIKAGFQVAFMAPTEILAKQHAKTIHRLFEPLGLSEVVGLLVGGQKPTQKRLTHEAIASGRTKLIIGTHALIQEKVDMHRLGLVVVDEQHRFGVEQRKALQSKAGHMPHVLNMTATPIPRSLALTLYGEMDISIIDTKPEGRKPIITSIQSPNSRKQLYEKIDTELDEGRQMFVVTPLIRESDSLPAKSAEEVYTGLRQGFFKNKKIGLLHGKMKPADKDRVMQMFAKRQLDILVSTTVIEVGVDIPNATIMLIENAERFGLAQIHQLRGRVGRSEHQGYCYLMMGDSSEPSRRLRALEQTDNGFKLAEMDLEIRGPGAIYGTIQHGQLDLRIAKLTDTKLISQARQAAQEFIDRGENLLEYSQLHERVQSIRAVTNLN